MTLSSVDFPAPDGPVIESHSPRSSARSTSTSAWTAGSLPYVLQTLFSSSTRVVEKGYVRSRHGYFSGLSVLSTTSVTHNDELTRLELPFNRLHFDKTVGYQSRFDRDVLQRAFIILDLHSRSSISRQS